MLGFSNNQQQNIQDRNNMQQMPMLPVPMNQQMPMNNMQRNGPIPQNNMNVMLNQSGANNNNNTISNNNNNMSMGTPMNANTNNNINPSSLDVNNMNTSTNHQNQNMGNDGLYGNGGGIYSYPVSMMNSNSNNNYYQYNNMNNFSIYQQQPPLQSQTQQIPQQALSQQNQPYFMPQLSQQNSSESQTSSQNASQSQPNHQGNIIQTGISNQQSSMINSGISIPSDSSLQQQSQPSFYSNPSSFLMNISNNHSNSQSISNQHQNNLIGNNNGNFVSGNSGNSLSCNNSNMNMNYNSTNGYSPFNTNLYANFNGGFNSTNSSLNNSNSYTVNNINNTNDMSTTVVNNNNTAVNSTVIGSNTNNNTPSNMINTNNTNNITDNNNGNLNTNLFNGYHPINTNHPMNMNNSNMNVNTHNNMNNNGSNQINSNSINTPFVNSINSQLNPNAAAFTLSTPSNNERNISEITKESLLTKKASVTFSQTSVEASLSQNNELKNLRDVNIQGQNQTKPEISELKDNVTNEAKEIKDTPSLNDLSESISRKDSISVGSSISENISSHDTPTVSSIDSKHYTSSNFIGNSSYGGLTTTNSIGNNNGSINTSNMLTSHSSFSNFNISMNNGRNSMQNSTHNNFNISGNNSNNRNNSNMSCFNGMMSMPIIPPNGGNSMINNSHLIGTGSVFSSNNQWSNTMDNSNRMNLPMNSAGGNNNGNNNGLNSGLGSNNMKLMMNGNGISSNINSFSMTSGPNGIGSWDWNSNFSYNNGFYDGGNGLSKFNSNNNDFYHSGDNRNLKNGQQNNINLISSLTNGINNMNLNTGSGFNILSNNNNNLLSNTLGKGRINNGLGITTNPITINTNNTHHVIGPTSAKSQDNGLDSVLTGKKIEVENEELYDIKESNSTIINGNNVSNTLPTSASNGSLLSVKMSKEDLILNSKEFVPSIKHDLILTKDLSTLALGRDKIFSSNTSSLKPSPNLTSVNNEARMGFGINGAVNSFNPSNSNSSINTLVNFNMNSSMGSIATTGANNGTDLALKRKKSVAIPFTTRPGFGQAGRKIKLKANFYAIKNLLIENVHQYEFVIVQKSPRKDTNISPELLRLLYQRWWEIFKKENHKPLYPVFDGRHYIFSATRLPFQNDKAVYTINLVRDGNVSSERVFEITLRKVQEISMEGLHKFLAGQNLEVPTEALSVIDTIFRHFPSFLDNQFSIVGRSFFTNDDIEEISNGVQLWRGHHQSLKASRDRLLINIDISATAFYKPGPLKNVIQNFFGKDDLKILLNDTERQHIESFLKGIKIKINYRDNSRRTYKILRFSNLPANQQMITNIQTKNEQSVSEYFKEAYNITLKYPHIPCIDVGKVSQPIYIPIELCEVPDGQKYLKKLNEKQTTEMIKFTCQLPNLREGKINSGRKRLQPDNNECFNSLNLLISNQMEVVDARILPAPTIVFNKESQEPKIRPNGGIWSLKNKKLALGSTLSSWSILAFGKETDYPRETINNFLVELVKTLKENGVNVRNPNPPICYGNKNEIEESLYKAYHEACSCDIPIMGDEDEDHLTSISPGINRKLILCILPCRVNNTTPYYAEIKRIADTVIGVVTQCIQGRHITAPIKSYCGNLSLKINVKLGGYNNFILPEQIRFIMEEPTIVFGGNVTNPGPGDRIHPSIVALVGSMDCQCSHYIATTRIQERKKECIIKLSEMIVILFNKFYKINELMPKRILFYRDCISESQYQSVMQYELNEIREACKMIDPSYQPTITYIVVQKRHHARFFPMRKEESDSKGNILAGTVIESLITHPSQFDFYLCSHPGLQGTSRPTHYHVLYDEHNFTADELEELTYHMCFLYSRSTRAVSIVPPAYYAHLAAARVKYHAHEAWNEQEQQQQTNYINNGNSTSSVTTAAITDVTNANLVGNESSPMLDSNESLVGSGSNSTLGSSASSPSLDKSNISTSGNTTLTSSPSTSSLKNTQPVRRVLYESVKEELQEIMYFM